MELAVIFFVALLVIGPRRLPEAARLLGRAMGEFRKATGELSAALKQPTAAGEPKAEDYPPKPSSAE